MHPQASEADVNGPLPERFEAQISPQRTSCLRQSYVVLFQRRRQLTRDLPNEMASHSAFNRT